MSYAKGDTVKVTYLATVAANTSYAHTNTLNAETLPLYDAESVELVKERVAQGTLRRFTESGNVVVLNGDRWDYVLVNGRVPETKIGSFSAIDPDDVFDAFEWVKI